MKGRRRATRTIIMGLTRLLTALIVTTSPVAAGAQVQRVTIQLPGYGAPIFLDTLGTWRDVPGGADSVYQILRSVYADLMIPTNLTDSATRYVGATNYKKTRTLAGGPMSRLVECGSGITGPNADSYRIHLAVVSRVEIGDGGKSRIRTAVVAAGEDISGPSKDPIPCGSTGNLEARIHDLVIQRMRAR